MRCLAIRWAITLLQRHAAATPTILCSIPTDMMSFGKRFGFERLESRTVLNGTVFVTGALGALTLQGDTSSNYLLIRQIGTTPGGGVNIRVQGLATTLDNVDTGTSGSVFTFTGVTNIAIDLSQGGNDHLTLININISGQGDVGIGFGGGSDILTMTNVKAQNVAVSLGGGNDMASLVNITAAAGGFALDAGAGRDTVVLNHVQSGTPGSGGGIAVEMGPGNRDVLTVVICSADMAAFAETSGTNGVLVWKHTGNHFGAEADAGFQIVV